MFLITNILALDILKNYEQWAQGKGSEPPGSSNDLTFKPAYINAEYLDASNLYGWAMSKKLPVNGFKWENDLSKFTENFIKYYDENSDVGYFLEVDIEYLKQLWGHHKDLPFLPERKQALNHG